MGSKVFSWGLSAQKFVDLIPAGTLLADPKHVLPNVSMEVQVVRKVNAHIGNTAYVMYPGETYVVPENVYDVLFASGAIQ